MVVIVYKADGKLYSIRDSTVIHINDWHEQYEEAITHLNITLAILAVIFGILAIPSFKTIFTITIRRLKKG